MGSVVSESRPAALHAARLAMLKQLHLHLPIEESKMWNDDTQTDVISLGSIDQQSVAAGINGFMSISEGHYRIPKKKMSAPLFFHSDKECPRFQTLYKNKFSTLSLRSSTKKKSAAGRFVLHLKRTFSSRNLLFQRPISSTSQYKENFCPSLNLKELPKHDQDSPFTLYASNTLTNANHLSKKIDENSEFSLLKRKIAALEILETQNGKENKPLSEDRNNTLIVLPEDRKSSLTILPEENNTNNFFINTIENDSIVPSSCMSSNTSLGSIDHRDNARPVRIFTNEISLATKLNCNLYQPHRAPPYDQETGMIDSLSPLCHYRRTPPPVPTHSCHSQVSTSNNTMFSKLGDVFYSRPYNIRSPSGLEKAVNFNYGGIDEWRREIRNSMHLGRKKDNRDTSLFF
ncbi:uncharacterized protein T551_02274 [Pneumocystis jirovecii RU7]|uniref:Uncharacterized protein n=1 Tax=Pneumocystis jirovecii (strain RU7) TaxID=1408657 RepID=A0A0W4ZKW0_PNEJ7|nr:uncharacterized protein T551_02274 [Pneumocystis jirovecii RU7]KTW29000.1 hypothetical protein T551_02274 [Pneumocystis jirovecii RU7]